MRTHHRTKDAVRFIQLSAAIFCAFILLCCDGGGGNGEKTEIEVPNGSFQPSSGTWRGTSDFGSIEFVVNTDGSGIDEITLYFSDYSCGIVTSNVTLTTIYSPSPLGIDDHEFTAEESSGSDRITLQGAFGTSDRVTGNFTADYDVNSSTCSGSWSASPATNASSVILEWDDSTPQSTINREYSGGLLSKLIFHRRFFVKSGSGVVDFIAAIKEADGGINDEAEESFTVAENNTYDIAVGVMVGGHGTCGQYMDFIELSSPSVANSRKIYFDDCVSAFEINDFTATIY